MRLRGLLFLLLIPTLAGCAIAQDQAAEGTELTIRAVNSGVGRAEFHLSCEPPRGDLPDPARACAALSRAPDLVTHPEPIGCRAQWCAWDVTIEGSLDGKSIDTDFVTYWTEQTLGLGISRVVLQKNLLPRRHEELLPETKRVFEPGELEVADLITCDIRGHHLEAGVPSDTGPLTVGYSGATVGVYLTVQRREDGSVVADCH